MFNNVDLIIAALKQSLARCQKYEEPAEYVYQLNQVLNRFKTNLYKFITEDTLYEQDPKEFIQFRIATGWRTGLGFNGLPRFLDSSPITLYVNGHVPNVQRQNKDCVFHKAVVIDDVIDIHRIRGIKEDYYTGALMSNSNYVTEQELIIFANPEAVNNVSMYFHSDKVADDVIVFNFQLNALVYQEAIKEHEEKRAAAFKIDPSSINRHRRKNQQLPVEQTPVAQVAVPASTEEKVDAIFNPPPVDSTVERLERIRKVVADRKKNNTRVTRKRHSYW